MDDYVLSETVLKESRMHDELHFDTYLTADDVIAATRDTMDDTISYIKQRYGDARGYMGEVGLYIPFISVPEEQEWLGFATHGSRSRQGREVWCSFPLG